MKYNLLPKIAEILYYLGKKRKKNKNSHAPQQIHVLKTQNLHTKFQQILQTNATDLYT